MDAFVNIVRSSFVSAPDAPLPHQTEDTMRPIHSRLLLLLSACLFLTTAPQASAQAMAICHEGGPGSTKQAAKAVETFLRHTEATAGLGANSLSGEYHTKRGACDAYLKSGAPALVVLDLATHLRKASAMGLKPIAHLGRADAVTWHIVVREGSHSDLASLAGKTVLTTAPQDEAFIQNIVFAQKGPKLALTPSRRALKALRDVGRGKADAALVDQDAVKHMGELELPHKLVSIYASEGLPGLTMSATSESDLVSKVKGALGKLCEGEGRKLCKNFKVQRFQSANQKRFKALLKRYAN